MFQTKYRNNTLDESIDIIVSAKQTPIRCLHT